MNRFECGRPQPTTSIRTAGSKVRAICLLPAGENVSTALELQWRSQVECRRRIIKLMLLVIFGFAIIVLFLCLWVTQPLFFKPQLSQSSAVDPARLQAHVQMLSVQFSPRDQSHTENLDRAAGYIREQLLEAGGKVTEQPFAVEGRTYRNVIASFGPETSERIVVGAHYDAYQVFPAPTTMPAA